MNDGSTFIKLTQVFNSEGAQRTRIENIAYIKSIRALEASDKAESYPGSTSLVTIANTDSATGEYSSSSKLDQHIYVKETPDEIWGRLPHSPFSMQP